MPRKRREIMRTTMLYVEFLVGGILVLLALIFLGVSIFPSTEKPIMNLLEQKGHLSASILLSPIFVAAAYAIGVFSEYFTRSLFEDKLDEIKVMRTKIYLKENYYKLWKSPILKEYLRIPLNEIDKKNRHKRSTKMLRSHATLCDDGEFRSLPGY
jgi:hypothetical protein